MHQANPFYMGLWVKTHVKWGQVVMCHVTRSNGAQYSTTAYRSPINFGPKDSKNVAYCGGMKCCVVHKLAKFS